MASEVHDEAGEYFDVTAQAEFLKGMSNYIPKEGIKLIKDRDKNAFDMNSTIDVIINSLRAANVPEKYVDMVERAKRNGKITEAVAIFQAALEGKTDVSAIAQRAPPNATPFKPTKFIAFRDDPGVKGEVVTGTFTDGETDIIRWSNYLTGPGTTVGGAGTATPLTISDMAVAINNTMLYKYIDTKRELDDVDNSLAKLKEEENLFYGKTAAYSEKMRANQKLYKTDLVVSAFEKRTQVRDALLPKREGFKKRQRELTEKLVLEVRKKNRKLMTQRRLGLIGNGVRGLTGTFGLVNGAIDITAGDQMLENAEKRRNSEQIDDETYRKAIRDGTLRIAQGAFGIVDGVNNLGRVATSVFANEVRTLSDCTKKGLRYASAVGGVLAIGLGCTAVAKHSLAAQDALGEGNVGKAIMYGIMAGLDTFSVMLDAMSVAFDFIPGIGTAASLALDLLNTFVDAVNLFIGFFADAVDSRSPDEHIEQAFEKYIKSETFSSFVEAQADVYRKQNYDYFVYIVDAKSVGIEMEGGDATKADRTVFKDLNDRAIREADKTKLRRVIIDQSATGRIQIGGEQDDLIFAGEGGDTLYGNGGDDILFGEAGEDEIYGGEGNDYLNGGTSKDDLFGDSGDDFHMFQPGVDNVNGGSGFDTISITGGYFATDTSMLSTALVVGDGVRNRVYVDLHLGSENGRGGLALGALFNDIRALSNPTHKFAFAENSEETTELLQSYNSAHSYGIYQSELDNVWLWYLTKKENTYYLTDTEKIISCELTASGDIHNLKKSNYSFSISKSAGVYNKQHHILERGSGWSKLKVQMAFAFVKDSKIQHIENVSVPLGSEVSCQVIGGANTKVIDSSSGHNTYIYTSDKNTVVTVTLSHSPEYEMFKYIVGGTGNNTLVIYGGSQNAIRPGISYASHQCILLDHDVDLAKANRKENEANTYAWSNSGDKVDRGIYIKNVQVLEFSNMSTDSNSFKSDCTNLSEGHSFVINSNLDGLRFCGSAGNDNIYVKSFMGTDNLIDGYRGLNLLSLHSFPLSYDTHVDIDQPPGLQGLKFGELKGGGHSVRLNVISSVQGNARTKFIGGHVEFDNMLVADGGTCTIESRGGRNTIVAKRGRHILKGGSGPDIYELFGPVIEGVLIIAVTNRKNEGVRVKCNGVQSHGKSIEIQLLQHDHAEVLLQEGKVRIVNETDATTTQRGTVTVSSSKRLLTYNAGSVFDDLDPNKTESVRIRYATEGSEVTIDDRSEGNALKLHNYTDKSQLRVVIDEDNCLLWKERHSNVNVCKDKYWGNLYSAKVRNLSDLFNNYMARFPAIQFVSENRVEYELRDKELCDFLSEHLRDLMFENNGFGNIYEVTTSYPSEVILQGGDNILRAQSEQITYKGGDGSDIFDMTIVSQGSSGHQPSTVVEPGNGDSLIVVSNGQSVDMTVNYPEHRKKGERTIMFYGYSLSRVFVTKEGSNGYRFAYGTVLMRVNEKPDRLIFEVGSKMELVESYDMNKYLEKRVKDEAFHCKLVATKVGKEYYMWGQFDEYSWRYAHLHIYPQVNGLKFVLTDRRTGSDDVLYEFFFAMVPLFDFPAINIVNMFQFLLHDGMKFYETHFYDSRIREFIMNLIRLSESHTIARKRNFLSVVNATDHSTPTVYLPDIDVLVYADKPDAEIYGGLGNNLFKVMSPSVLINTGSNQGSDGHDIIHIASEAEETRVRLIPRGGNTSHGLTFVVLEGHTTLTISIPKADDKNSELFTIMEGDRKIVTFEDKAPSYILFGYAGEYEMVWDVGNFLQKMRNKQWKQELLITQNQHIVLVAEKTNVDDFYVDVQGISGNRTSVLFASHHHTLYVAIIPPYVRGSTITKGELAVHIAACISGGIRFRDRTVTTEEIISFLQGAEWRVGGGFGHFAEGGPSSTLDDMLKLKHPYEKFLTALQNCHETMRITAVDPDPHGSGEHEA